MAMSEAVEMVYRFHCRACGHDWQWRYESRQQRDASGNTWNVYYRGSVPVASPWLAPICPRCSRYRIDIEQVRRPAEEELTPLGSTISSLGHPR